MARLLLRLAVFLAPVISGLGFLEWKLRDGDYDYKHIRRIVDSRGPAAVVLVTGSSYEQFALDPARLPCEGINVSNANQSLPVSAALLAHGAATMPKLKVALIGLSPYSLDYRMAEDDRVRWSRFQASFGKVDGEEGAWRDRFLVVSLTPREGLNALRRPAASLITDRGWFASAKAGSISSDDVTKRLNERVIRMDRSNRAGNLQAVARMIDRARKIGAVPVILVSPVSPAYRAAMPTAMVDEFLGVLRALLAEENVIVANYLSDHRFHDDDFTDPDHLSRDGARKFSGFVAEEVVGPALGIARAGGSPDGCLGRLERQPRP